MPRRDAAAARHDGRHVRDRLQATLGGAGLPAAEGSGPPFEYNGGRQPSPEDNFSGGPGAAEQATGKTVPALRWRTGFRAALLVGALAVLGGAFFWWQVAAGQPQVVPLSEVSPHHSSAGGAGEPPVQGAEGSDPQDPAAGDGQPGRVIVHVAGAVAMPGVVQLPAGSRVHQAIAAAGGGIPPADLNRLNLAALLTDGQKLYVPQAGEHVPAGTDQLPIDGAGGGGPAAGGKVNLNTAGVEELDALPKVGPVLAQRIVDWRKDHGLFKSVEELDAIDGVGPKMLETLLPLVVV